MNEETKNLLKKVINHLSSLEERYSLLMQAFVLKIEMSDEEKKKLSHSAQVSEHNCEMLRQSIENWK